MEDDDDDKTKAAPPWLDLPDYLTEMILKRLPLRGYVVFAAVCRQWRSIQRAHRCRPHPCLLSSSSLVEVGREYYSPFDTEFYPLRLSGPAAACQMLICQGSSHGWLLLYDSGFGPMLYYRSISYQPFLFNPVSGDCIQLPPPPEDAWRSFISAMSGPPTDPQCALLLGEYNNAYLLQLNADNHWKQFSLPTSQWLRSVVYVGGKFYCISSEFKLYVVDPFCAAPVMLPLQMECSPELLRSRPFLVESDGEVLAVIPLDLDKDHVVIEGFKVFKADLERKVWVRVEGLGDRALFIAGKGSVSLSAVEVGCRKNCIYYPCWVGTLTADLSEAWKVFEAFDLETGRITHGQPVPNTAIMQRVCDYNNDYNSYLDWFLPKLDYPHST